MTIRIKLRRDTAANWNSANPVLALGEAGYDTTNNQIRVGNGVDNWQELSAIGGVLTGEVAGLTLTAGIPYANGNILTSPVSFTRPNNSESTVDAIDTGLTLKRKNSSGGIYNSAGDVETSWSNNQSPLGTEWNADGWGDLTDVQTRAYTTFYNACEGQIGENVVHKEFVMHDTINDKYYKIDFNWWQPNNGGGNNLSLDNRSGFSYTRTLIDTTKLTYIVRPINDSNVVDAVGPGVTIKRDSAGGIYNSDVDAEWDPDVSPSGTLWNDEGWTDFTDITTRTWKPLYAAVHGQLGNHLVGRELLMQDTINGKYYIVKFTDWGQNNGGSFAYYRREINPHGPKLGITFPDGTTQKSAYDLGNLKIQNDTISLANNDLEIRTIADPEVDADIGIYAADDLWLWANGDRAELGAANEVRIISGDQELRSYYAGIPTWDGNNLSITDYNSDTELSLQLYLSSTYSIWFRTDAGKWYKTYSTTNASYDGGTTTYTIPVNANNDGDPLPVTDVWLRDPFWTGNKEWQFDRYGNLEPPYINVPQQFGTFNNPTLQIGNTYDDVVITNTMYNNNNRGNGYGIYIQGARGYGDWGTSGPVGMGTEVYVVGGAGGEGNTAGAGGEGGNVYLKGGVGQNGGHGGHVRITAGDSQFLNGGNTVQSGNVYITGGNATAGNGIPGGQGIAGSIYLTTGVTESAGTQGAIQLSTYTSNGGTENIWKFNSDGTTQLPLLAVNLHNGGSQTGRVLQFSDPAYQSIITGPAPANPGDSAQRLIIQGQNGGTGEGGDVYLWAGDAQTDGGDIKIYAGDADGISAGYGGYINLKAGNGYNLGGHIEIEAGSSSAYTGGNINIRAGGGAMTNGSINLYTNPNSSKQWTLGADGSTTLPGAVVKSTVAKTYNPYYGIPTELGDATYLVPIVDGSYGPFTLSGIGFTVLVSGGAAAYTIISNSGPVTLNDVIGTLDAGDLGGTPGNLSNISVTSVNSPTIALDLTKSINKLANGFYTLADGVEGQIMYLVPQIGTVYNGDVIITVAHARVMHNSGSDPAAIYTNIDWSPFKPSSNNPTVNVVTLIFTDSAWQASHGIWN